jgi:hypothetical protein
MLIRAKSCCLILPDVRRSAPQDCTCTRCLQHLRGKPSPARSLAAAEPVKSETIVVLDLRGIERSSGPTGATTRKYRRRHQGSGHGARARSSICALTRHRSHSCLALPVPLRRCRGRRQTVASHRFGSHLKRLHRFPQGPMRSHEMRGDSMRKNRPKANW